MKRILIIEDDPHILLGLKDILESEGFSLAECPRGDEALGMIRQVRPHLIVLDVMLPGMSGFDICAQLRRQGDRTPVLMLTAKGQEVDKVLGLELGADDYVTKPFGLRELVARVRALLRRAEENSRGGNSAAADGAGASRAEEEDPVTPAFHIGQSEVVPATYHLRGAGRTIDLTAKEMQLLQHMAKHRGVVLSRDHLLNAVWGINYFGTTRTLDQTIAQIRKKLKHTGTDPEIILTVHGVGYRLLA
jgi:DNA-binding response OmpR family regulator